MTKSDLLKYIDTMLTQRSDGNIGLLMVRQYVKDNMREMVFRCPSCDELIYWEGEADHRTSKQRVEGRGSCDLRRKGSDRKAEAVDAGGGV